MTCGNPIKHKLQNAFKFFIEPISFERKLSDDQMECIQFEICDYAPKLIEEVPFFITNQIGQGTSIEIIPKVNPLELPFLNIRISSILMNDYYF